MSAFSYRIPRNALEQDGVVYFFRAERDGLDLIKIGHSTRERFRRYQLTSDYKGEMIASVDGGLIEEYVCQRLFAADQHQGEWFRPTSALLAFVAQCAKHGALLASAQVLADDIRRGANAIVAAEDAISGRKPHYHARNMGEL